ncbi:MAG: adenylosuccinate lyase [Chloroflexi bacterium]|nr:adenylosuccinate lyase [Chloroflexota bacterium]
MIDPTLIALSPLDGRYARETESLRAYFSEFAFIRTRVRIEIEYLLALSRDVHLVRDLTDAEISKLQSLISDFDLDDAARVKDHEARTRHDVKAIEYFLRDQLVGTPLADVIEWLHFGLTSEDVNQTAYALALRDARDAVILLALDRVIAQIAMLAREHKATPMLARTHGQPAVPTTLGKEFAVFLARLKKQRASLGAHCFEAKLTGAVGNFNALVAAAPNVDWLAFSEKFIRAFDLEPNLVTTQLAPYDNWIYFFDAMRLTNSILIDLAQDVWRYISDDIFKLRVVVGEVGSSTMPQKVNPIDFENAEGNLGIADALFAHYSEKLPRSRLQRDLSDSTVRRTFGVALGHSIIAYANIARGLERITAHAGKSRTDLDAQWQVIAEGAQTILRAGNFADAYEAVKELTRGKSLTRENYHAWIEALAVDESVKTKLRELSPLTYTGLAEQIVERVIK